MNTFHFSQALEESEYLALGHQLNMRPELPIMSCVLMGPASNKLGQAQQQSCQIDVVYKKSGPSWGT